MKQIKQKAEKNEQYTSSISSKVRDRKKRDKIKQCSYFPGGISFFCAHISRYSCSAVPGVNNWGWRPQIGTFWRDEEIVNSASCVLVLAANDKGPFLLLHRRT
ncbi:hypothetical protein CEXT_502241 [Caerostris extrusa]|uniref:Uncharacterized protein n=1 Tax=Caerostris extrusa TaxID=172846 RepID=A0AAV4U907_CAEEX|nr:hypothetical protein CEXT_502241 [Caerostris extrusa]